MLRSILILELSKVEEMTLSNWLTPSCTYFVADCPGRDYDLKRTRQNTIKY